MVPETHTLPVYLLNGRLHGKVVFFPPIMDGVAVFIGIPWNDGSNLRECYVLDQDDWTEATGATIYRFVYTAREDTPGHLTPIFLPPIVDKNCRCESRSPLPHGGSNEPVIHTIKFPDGAKIEYFENQPPVYTPPSSQRPSTDAIDPCY